MLLMLSLSLSLSSLLLLLLLLFLLLLQVQKCSVSFFFCKTRPNLPSVLRDPTCQAFFRVASLGL